MGKFLCAHNVKRCCFYVKSSTRQQVPPCCVCVCVSYPHSDVVALLNRFFIRIVTSVNMRRVFSFSFVYSQMLILYNTKANRIQLHSKSSISHIAAFYFILFFFISPNASFFVYFLHFLYISLAQQFSFTAARSPLISFVFLWLSLCAFPCLSLCLLLYFSPCLSFCLSHYLSSSSFNLPSSLPLPKPRSPLIVHILFRFYLIRNTFCGHIKS